MHLLIAIGQGLGLAAAAGLLASAPLALAATAANLGWLDGPLSFAGRPWLVAVTWAAVLVELVVDAAWPGAQAGARLARRVAAGGLAFELAAGHKVPYAGLAIGAVVAAGVGLAMRRIRSGAVKSGGDLRGTALVEDMAGVGAAALAVVPFVGYLLAVAAGGLCGRASAAARARSTRACGCSGSVGQPRGQEADHGGGRRARPCAARLHHRRRHGAHSRLAGRRGFAHRRLRLHLPVAHPGVPVGTGHRPSPRRLADPQHDLVSPRRGPVRRVRLVADRHARRPAPGRWSTTCSSISTCCTCRRE